MSNANQVDTLPPEADPRAGTSEFGPAYTEGSPDSEWLKGEIYSKQSLEEIILLLSKDGDAEIENTRSERYKLKDLAKVIGEIDQLIKEIEKNSTDRNSRKAQEKRIYELVLHHITNGGGVRLRGKVKELVDEALDKIWKPKNSVPSTNPGPPNSLPNGSPGAPGAQDEQRTFQEWTSTMVDQMSQQVAFFEGKIASLQKENVELREQNLDLQKTLQERKDALVERDRYKELHERNLQAFKEYRDLITPKINDLSERFKRLRQSLEQKEADKRP